MERCALHHFIEYATGRQVINDKIIKHTEVVSGNCQFVQKWSLLIQKWICFLLLYLLPLCIFSDFMINDLSPIIGPQRNYVLNKHGNVLQFEIWECIFLLMRNILSLLLILGNPNRSHTHFQSQIP